MAGKSLYETLEISSSATDDEIKKAYRKLARKYHPDINKEPTAEEKFKEINAAYEILSDPAKRKQYDQFGDSMFGNQSFHDFTRSNYSGGDFDLNDILSRVFGGGFSSRGGFDSGFNFGGIDLDINARMSIPFETAVLGGTHTVSMNGEKIDIKIPAGIQDGDSMRVRGKGRQMQSQRGDLILKVGVEPSNEYVRNGDDLEKEFKISLKTAIFGGKVSIKTLEKEVSLKVPAGTKCAQRFRIRGEGATNRKTQTKGDLYLKAQVVIPNASELDSGLAKMMQEKLSDMHA